MLTLKGAQADGNNSQIYLRISVSLTLKKLKVSYSIIVFSLYKIVNDAH